ncbi:MAG: hypothetical protein V4723_15825 [Pseudomonadota bacterium]
MASEKQAEKEQAADPSIPQQDAADDEAIDDLMAKKPEELTPEELRLMADTMPGEGPGDD